MNDDIIECWERVVEAPPDRLDRWLHQRLAGYSMARIRELVAEGRVKVNGRPVTKGERMVPGDVVRVEAVASGPGPLPDHETRLEVAYEDSEVLVVDKPAGMPTHPLSPEQRGTLLNAAVARWPELRGVGRRELEPGLVHRLDTGTSGLVMLARTRECFAFLLHELHMHRVVKIYRALVRGEVLKNSGEIRVPLARHRGKSGRMVPVVEGARFRGPPMEALTRYRVLERGKGISLLELDLVTGVMHQLRVHLAFMGYPVLGDDRYGDAPDPGSKVYALQAARLSFTASGAGARVNVRVSRPLCIKDAGRWSSSIT